MFTSNNSKSDPSTIVLDLDATLIHSRDQDNDQSYSGLSKFDKFHTMSNDYLVVERPHLQKFLDYLFNNFDNVIVWTAASKEYAEFIIDRCIIKPKSRPLDWYFFSYHCDMSDDKYGSTKDLKLLTDFFKLDDCSKNNIMIIDDYDNVFDGNPNKCIIAPEFDSEEKESYKDDFLLRLIECFEKNMDVNSINKQISGLSS
jgi:TFIIF-interacting CTD phosphatase-like protein